MNICRNTSPLFKVIATETYSKELDKWSNSEQETAEKMAKSLAESPLQGKPLGYPFLREKKISGKRIYYLIYHTFLDQHQLHLLLQYSIYNYPKNHKSGNIENHNHRPLSHTN